MATRKSAMGAFVTGAGAGAATEYLLDPQQGKRRRHMLVEKLGARLRRGERTAGQKASYAAGKAQGLAAEATPPGRDSSELNDSGLKAKVETEVFRPAGAPKGSVDVNVEHGVVYLRGEAESRELIEELTGRAARVEGVTQVENLLHLPGEPAHTHR